MIADLSKAYEVLGVKPGVSNRELKAAHRDLAKVWHPDRFLHDPRLQEKAQEKLKEINEAYELLISGKTPITAPARPQQTPRRASSGKWAAVLLVFVAVFAVTTRALLQHRKAPLQAEVETSEPAKIDQEAATRPTSNTRTEATRKAAPEESAPEETVAPPSQPTPALATVTVTIDPESGLLAKADCPVRSRMTYPRGSEPSGYCNISHAPPPKESRIKTIAEKILPQRRKGAAEEGKSTN